MHPPRVSLGMPVCNSAQHLEAALESLLAQTYTNFELIISDNASTDETQAICERFQGLDSRIRYDRNERRMSAAWNVNRVFSLARGPYFKHAAPADLCAPTFLERCVDVLERDPSAVMAFSRTAIIDESGSELARCAEMPAALEARPHIRFRYVHDEVAERAVCHPIFGVMRVAPVRNRELIRHFAGADMMLLAELALAGNVVEVPEDLFKMRRRAGAHRFSGAFDAALTHFRWLYEYVVMIARVSLTPFERLCCYQQMPRWIYDNRNVLASELANAVNGGLRRNRAQFSKEAY